ncbi:MULTISPECIES: 16S rRNA (guanine(966)-N(2))-methyltransferase RsmD [unclassified Brevibacterium]|uniref:16S rRNA (guanine(966)-N(2))-methyltransferase RsmD n=1 Tax=Brevibacterium TaxID=1696 RepID=UPI0027957ACE|nr:MULTISPECIES: 16S rRNA (guanine(966)-N(2))-methyltransferase RsmD [unclassified Brevibacterium]
MRIVAGSLSGRRIRTPGGSATRPTSDRVRESLFASLEALGMLDGARVLDVFAGSGALGLEALSRGAAHAAFVEKARSASAVVAANIADLGVAERTRLITGTAPAALGQIEPGETDLVFADPPYPLTEAQVTQVLAALVPLLRDASSLVVLERSTRSPEPTLPEDLQVFKHKTHGETALWWLEKK